jgi:hypothetical protein
MTPFGGTFDLTNGGLSGLTCSVGRDLLMLAA